MKPLRKTLQALGVAAAIMSAPAIAGNAVGTPQRNATPPPGLAKLLLLDNPGIARALIATEGSNSRLQDFPDSP